MSYNFSLGYVLCQLVLTSVCFGQSNNNIPNPSFTPFAGTIYKMPILEKKKGKLTTRGIQEFYSDTIYSYEKIREISLDKINITEQSTHEGSFPGIDNKTRFAMVLHSTMTIPLDACYEFSLHTDDGSKLWIDGNEVIDNDGGHGMRLKKDSIVLKQGEYGTKLWYFQGMADRFGFIFDAKIIGKPDVCQQAITLDKKRTFELGSVNFDLNSKSLNTPGLLNLEKIISKIENEQVDTIQIIGHTDDLGTQEYNDQLSFNRALRVKNHVESILGNSNIQYVIEGKGNKEPITTESTDAARARNRRVEIIIK